MARDLVGPLIAQPGSGGIEMRIWNVIVLSCALVAPMAISPVALRADDDRDRGNRERVYHDKGRNDEHHWDNHEDRAYRMWAKENHRKYQNFERLRAEDQERYWAWRHEHSDAVLKIDIR